MRGFLTSSPLLPVQSPSPSPSESPQGVFVFNLPTDSSETLLKVSALDVIALATGIALMTMLAVLMWRAMQRPRLRLVWDDSRDRWTTTRRDIVQYVLSVPVLVFAWYYYLLLILLIAPNRLTAFKLALAPAALILAARFLAHVWKEAAHNLAKTVPLVIVTTVLLTLTVKSDADAALLFTDGHDVSLTWPSMILLVVADYVFTAAWFFWGARWRAMRGRRVPGIPWAKFPAAVAARAERD